MLPHHAAGTAGMYGLVTHAAPVDARNYTVDVEALRTLARRVKPKLITIGSSLNLQPHPIRQIRVIADEVGALVLFDAAHLCGMIAGRAWQQPLEEGAHLMTMSTYKSLGGPPSGLIVTNDPAIAEKLDKIAFPGMTANFDAAKSASLAITLLDWKAFGVTYAREMASCAAALAAALAERNIPVFQTAGGPTRSHQFAIEAAGFGGGQMAAKRLRRANILTCGIGLPIEAVTGDTNGLRLGTPEIVRWGMTAADMPELAGFIARGLLGNELPEDIASEVTRFRQRFTKLCFMN
jgi:glycine hydroxymethyltransferase